MGASLNPQTSDPEFANNPRHEFNLWFDPEAAHIVLRAAWKKVVCTPVDISVKTKMTMELINRIKGGSTPAAQYIGKFGRLFGEYNYLWDELTAAAWLDASLITKKETRFMDVDLDRGAGYGNVLTWSERDKPALDVQPVEVQVDLDADKLYKMMVDLLTAPTPKAPAKWFRFLDRIVVSDSVPASMAFAAGMLGMAPEQCDRERHELSRDHLRVRTLGSRLR